MGNIKLAQPRLAIMLLFAFFAFFLILTPIITGGITRLCERPEVAIRLSIIIQDILVFILPAIATALLCTRLPASLLGLDVKPELKQMFLAVLILLCSMPVMNVIVEWNKNIHLPESMAQLETTFRNMEDSAQAVVDNLMAGASVGSLIVSILIVGVLAGLSEELFFRGGMQRIFICTKMNPHVAIWSVAFIFSIFHFQFFGFVPRLLLGAYFGYLLWWSKSVWLPIVVHTINNSLVVYFTWHNVNNPDTVNPDTIGTDLTSSADILLICMSILLTVGLILYLAKICKANIK